MSEAQTVTAADPSPAGAPPQRSVGSSARLWFLFAAALALVALLAPRGDGTSTVPGGFLLDATGRPTTLGNHLSPITLIHFWATWCPPCITEIPALNRLADDYTGRAGFQIMMVAVDDDPAKSGPFVGNRGFAVLQDPQWDIAHRFGTRKLPETYVVVHGKRLERLKFVGAQNWDDPEIRAQLESIMDQVAEGKSAKEIEL